MNDLESRVAAVMAWPVRLIADAAQLGPEAGVMTGAVDAHNACVVSLILEDRASQLADERQRFIDDTAKRLFATPEYSRTDEAYDDAELLWDERERRRLAQPEPHPAMKRYRAADGSLVDAFQITAEWFDGEHPNPLHVTGIITDPVKRTVSSVALPHACASVGDWLIKPVGTDRWQVYRLPFLSDHEEVK